MKKSIIQLTVLMLLVAATMQSCTKNFVELNTSPNDSENAYPHQFMANVLIDAVSANMSRNRSFNNELMQVTVAIGDGEGKVFRYDFRRNWGEYLWNAHYININNFKEMYKQASKELVLNTSYQGISLLGQSWLFSILTDMYGDVPYSQAGLGLDSLILEPKFDKQQDIYMGIFETLDSVNNLLKINQAIDATHDPIYAGNVSRWRKFSNSLFLRLLMRASAKKETQDYVLPKIKEILETNSSNYP
ncbi:MAG: SusD/RagB family nutrient-binding outer membrane lipoprotein, partial [Sphingobacterium sp.]